MPLRPFNIDGPPAAAHFANDAADVSAAHFIPYLLPNYAHNAGTYGANLFADVPVYDIDVNNRSSLEQTSDNADVRTWLAFQRTWARPECIFCHAQIADDEIDAECPSRANNELHRLGWVRCPQATAGAEEHDFWGAACGSFACLGREVAGTVPPPLELCDRILERNVQQQYPMSVIHSGDGEGDLDLGNNGNIDHARLVALQGLLETAVGEMGVALTDWSADRRAFHHALLRLQLDLYGFTTAAGNLGNGDVGIATHASNWFSFDHFGIKTQVGSAGGNVVAYAQKVTDSHLNLFCNSLWDEGYEETVVKVTRIPARIAWVLSGMIPVAPPL